MNELMLRLIKDGKIVGYEYHNAGEIIQSESPDFIETINIGEGYECYPIDHDSFDLGIKVGDEWWHNNDLALAPSGAIYILHSLYETSDGNKFYWVFVTEKPSIVEGIIEFYYGIEKLSFRRIGTIYDKEPNHD